MDDDEIEPDGFRLVRFMEGMRNDEFESLVRNAMEITIASAYASLQGVSYIVSRFRESGSDKRVNILLAEDFHHNDTMRQIVINRILEIPNSEVRIYNKGALFHPKLYIFRRGSIVDVVVGSMNITSGGLFRNIEAGIHVRDPEVEKEALAFFEKYWAEAKTAKADSSLRIPSGDHIFNISDDVIQISTGMSGLVRAVEPDGESWTYEIYFSGENVRMVNESDLKLDPRKMLAGAQEAMRGLGEPETNPVRVAEYILWRKLTQAATQNLFAYQSSRTHHYDYQFIPLLKLLRGGSDSILIADEVGLGKTIEACIILEELKARNPLIRRVLVVCPKSLREKWEGDLRRRFDEYFDIVGKDALLQYDSEYKHGSEPTFNLIFPFSQLSFVSATESYKFRTMELPFDLVIVDEAHKIKNLQTNRRENLRRILDCTEYKVFLSATPVCTSSDDLLNLLKLLQPSDYAHLDRNDFKFLFVPHNHFVEARKKLDPQNPELDNVVEAKCILDEVLEFPPYAKQYLDSPMLKYLVKFLDDIIKGTIDLSTEALVEARRLLLDLNPVSNLVTRTRRVDLAKKNIPEREVMMLPIRLSLKEKDIHERILDRITSGTRKRTIETMTRERVTSSCLPAACVKELGMTWPDSLEDSKFTGLLGALREIRSGTPQNDLPKILIFSEFKPTISYLVNRLTEHFSSEHGDDVVGFVHGDVPSDHRLIKYRRFEQEENPRILICSEVASEGLDFQFCSHLVNYDLPWNPMRLEQRIGRIDRIGQQAEKIFIVNMVVEGTIDHAIYCNVVNGITEFNYTIGPTAEIVGRIEKELAPALFNPGLTPEQKQEKIRLYREAVLNARNREHQFNEERTALVGLDPYFTQEVSMRHGSKRFFTPEECQFVLNLFLEEVREEAGSNARIDGDELLLDRSALNILRERVINISGMSSKKRMHYVNLFTLKSGDFRVLGVTFNQEEACREIEKEFLTIHHPIIRSQLMAMRPHSSARRFTLKRKTKDKSILGRYLIAIMPVTFRRCKTESLDTYFELLCRVYNLADSACVGEAIAERIFQDIALARTEPGDLLMTEQIEEIQPVLERANEEMSQLLGSFETLRPSSGATKRALPSSLQMESDWVVGIIEYVEAE